MNIRKEILDSIEVVKRNDSVMEDISKRNDSIRIGMIILFLSVCANYFGLVLEDSKLPYLDMNQFRNVFFLFVSGLFVPLAGFMVMHYIASLKGGVGKFEEFLRVVLRGYILGWLGVIPLAFINIIMLWQLWVIHKSIMVVYKLNGRSALSVVLWSIAFFIGLTYLISALGVGFGVFSLPGTG